MKHLQSSSSTDRVHMYCGSFLLSLSKSIKVTMGKLSQDQLSHLLFNNWTNPAWSACMISCCFRVTIFQLLFSPTQQWGNMIKFWGLSSGKGVKCVSNNNILIYCHHHLYWYLASLTTCRHLSLSLALSSSRPIFCIPLWTLSFSFYLALS